MDQIVQALRVGVPDLSAFVGGSGYDELASLIALSHGVRVGFGRPTRWFHKHDTDQRFRDGLGMANQRLAEAAEQVVLLACGLPLALKP